VSTNHVLIDILFTVGYYTLLLDTIDDWLTTLFSTVNPYLMIIFCKQVRHSFVKLITFERVDLATVKKINVKPTVASEALNKPG